MFFSFFSNSIRPTVLALSVAFVSLTAATPTDAQSIFVSPSSVTQGGNFTASWSGFSGLVNVEVWKGTNFWVYANTAQPGSGSQVLNTATWEIRNDYRVRIVLQANPGVTATSPFLSVTLPASITVTYPNGGQTLTAGTNYTITWSSSNVTGNIQIDLYKGGSNVLQLAGGTPNTGSYPFNPPTWLTPGSDYRIGISAMGGSVSDFSNSFFTIQLPSITVTSPNGGQTLTIGSNYNIHWTSQSVTGGIQIDLYKGNSNVLQLAAGTANDGSYPFNPPSWLTPDCDYRIGISAMGGSVSDFSDSFFCIDGGGSITVTHPNGGESLRIGQNYTITWSSQNVTGGIQIDLYKNNSNVLQLAAGAPNTGTYPFNPPSWLTPGCDYEIGISAMSGTVSDFSNSNFCIIDPEINVTSPNGGESLQIGTDYTITWTSTDVTGNVQIDLYKGGTNVLQLAAGTENDGSYPFNPPPTLTPGSDYEIGMSGMSGTVADFSDANFSIVSAPSPNQPPVFTSMAPTGAQAGLPYSYDVDATDPDGNSIVYTLATAPVGAAIHPITGELTWIPSGTHIGTNSFVVRATDDGTPPLFQDHPFDVVVTSSNAAPTFSSTAPTAAVVGSEYSYQVLASDPNLDTITYSLDMAPSGATIDSMFGLILWTPTAGQVGTHTFSVIATDDGVPSMSTPHNFDVTVTAGNAPPTIDPAAPATVFAGSVFTYAVIATDPNAGDMLSYDLSQAPFGMAIDGGGVVTWTPTEADVGMHTFTVSVTDNGVPMMSASQDFDVEVLANDPIVTVIVHGQAIPFTSNIPGWMEALGQSILQRIATERGITDPGYGNIVEYQPDTGEWLYSASVSRNTGPYVEDEPTICLFNWVNDSADSILVPGPNAHFAEAAGEALFAALMDSRLVGDSGPLSGFSGLDRYSVAGIDTAAPSPLHFVAHSRGTSVTSECVRRLALANVAVDQVTSIDPHPVTRVNTNPAGLEAHIDFVLLQGDVFFELLNWFDPWPIWWSNTTFFDSYYRGDCNPTDFDGVDLGQGVINELDFQESCPEVELPGCGFEHVRIHEWYHLSADPNSTVVACTQGYMPPPASDSMGYAYARGNSEHASTRATTSSAASQTAPTPVELPFNGRFLTPAYASVSHAGWLLHGGAGYLNQFGAHDGVHCARLSGIVSGMTHNRFFLPAGSDSIALWTKVTNGGSGDTLEIAFHGYDDGDAGTDGNEYVLADVVPADTTTDWKCWEFSLDAVPKNRTYTLELRLDGGGGFFFGVNSAVLIDNIRIGPAGPQYCAVAPESATEGPASAGPSDSRLELSHASAPLAFGEVIDLGSQVIGIATTFTVELWNPGPDPIVVSDFYAPDSYSLSILSLPITIWPLTAQPVGIDVVPPSIGDFSGEVGFVCDAVDTPVVNFATHAFVSSGLEPELTMLDANGTPIVDAQPTAWNGEFQQYENGEVALGVRNDGSAPLELLNILVMGGSLVTAPGSIIGPGATTPLVVAFDTSMSGTHQLTLEIETNDADEGTKSILLVAEVIAVDFVRGDCNADGTYNIADAVQTLTMLFNPVAIPCVNACDSNDDNTVNIADAVYSLVALFSGGPDPAAPHPDCGSDPTPGGLSCTAVEACP